MKILIVLGKTGEPIPVCTKGEAMIYLLLAVAAFLTDTRIKDKIDSKEELPQKELLHGRILIRRVHNKGAVMSTFSKRPGAVRLVSAGLLLMMSVVALIIVPKKGFQLMKAGLSLAFGGAACNVYDRFRRGYVVDYFSFSFLKRVIFNLSDMFILFGAILAVIGEGVGEQ